MIWSQKNTLSWKADANGQLSLADNPLKPAQCLWTKVRRNWRELYVGG